MMKMNLQFFAHKKGVGSQRTVETQNQRDLVLKEQTDSLLRLETSFTDSVVQRFTQVLTLAVVVMIHYLLHQMVS